MSTFDYSKLATKAHELLLKFGEETIFTRTGGSDPGAFDPNTLAVASAIDATASVVAASFDYDTEKGGRFFADAGQGSLIQTGDRQVLMSPKTSAGATITWDPVPNDTIRIDGDTWRIVRLEQKVKPASTLVLFVLQARRGGE